MCEDWVYTGEYTFVFNLRVTLGGRLLSTHLSSIFVLPTDMATGIADVVVCGRLVWASGVPARHHIPCGPRWRGCPGVSGGVRRRDKVVQALTSVSWQASKRITTNHTCAATTSRLACFPSSLASTTLGWCLRYRKCLGWARRRGSSLSYDP